MKIGSIVESDAPKTIIIMNEKETLEKLHEECGVFGVFSREKIDTLSLVQFGLFALQHRGQEACGFSVLRDDLIYTYKGEGLVLDAFREIERSEDYHGHAVIGHTRYSTAGGQSKQNIQPFFVKNEEGQGVLSVAHNGHLVNAKELREELIKEGVTFVSDQSDSEVILRLIQKHMLLGLEEAIQMTVKRIRGAYSVLVLTQNEMAVFKDPNGIRPLCYGLLDEHTHVFSSETCGLDAIGAHFMRDIRPGQLVIAGSGGLRFSMVTRFPKRRICSFEYIYFSRPDSMIDGINVYKIREKCGQKLYEQYPVKADVVIGVPDSGVPAAVGYSKASGIRFKPILVKNKYVGRSFIAHSQKLRERIVNLKLNPILSEISGRKVVIIDDSIVRGTTSLRLVDILRKAGAEEIHFRSASPPIIAPCFLGVDTPSKKDLISANHSKATIKEMLRVDSLEFLSVDNLKEILGGSDYCFGCFTEKYPIDIKSDT
ncbi:MAG: amidophosphoribosyltransferase [Flavobacteriales bacterium Tduv]